MITHLSVRLSWHDSGWNGKICKSPQKNKYCTSLPHIRENKNELIEIKHKDQSLSNFKEEDYDPPCKAEIGIFSDHTYPITFTHPIENWNVPPLPETFTPYTFCPAPYRWFQYAEYNKIREKEKLQLRDLSPQDKSGSWIGDVRLQEKLLNAFWDKIEEKKSIVVFYVNSAPVEEDTKRIIIGIGRVLKKGKIRFYGSSDKRPDPNPVWQRMVTHNFPAEGFRLPYQEYLEQGLDPKHIVLTAPRDFERQFKYVTEHVSDSSLLVIVEQLSKIIDNIEKDLLEGRIKLKEDWNKRKKWIQSLMQELWKNRGQYPGIGCVLNFLGFTKGLSYQKEVLYNLEQDNENVLQHTLDILDGKKVAENNYKRDFEYAYIKWRAYSKDKNIRKFLELLMRLEISEDQIERLIKKELRIESGLNFSEIELVNNPYLIAELDKGLLTRKGEIKSERIPFDIIDQAMIPSFYLPEKYKLDDDRRVRALMIETLKEAASEGDSLLSLHDILLKIRERFPEERTCIPDPYLINSNRKFYEECIEFIGENTDFVALKYIRDYERTIAVKIKELIEGNEYNKSIPNWETIMNKRFGAVADSELGIETEKIARIEKTNALNILFSKKFSILTGKAGTGKTEVLNILIEGLIESEKQKAKDFLILAPTGKARVRINKTLNIPNLEAKTIHQHLNLLGWLDDSFNFKFEGGEKTFARTIIIDECSMLAEDLFATLIRSIDFTNVSRFILVGDPNQLPPIGPGRPFDDIIRWLKNNENYYNNLAVLKERVRQKKKDSLCLQLADGFLRDFKSKDIEEIYCLINEEKIIENDDLSVYFWDTLEELYSQLDKALNKLGINDYDTYKESVGISSNWDAKKCESWQVLSPVKQKEICGTGSINNYLQNKFLGKTLEKWRRGGYYGKGLSFPKPFGETKDIIHEDKVIQNINTRKLECYPDNPDKYVANGEIGIVKSPYGFKDRLNVRFSDQSEYWYTYYNGGKEQSVEFNLDLAYAITIHKSQGSDFENVILIIPEGTYNLSMEMMYTALTRFKKKTFLLLQKGIDTLQKYRHASSSETDNRNTYLFTLAVRDDISDIPYAENRIHKTSSGFLVRSKSEVIIANALIKAGIQLSEKNYEKKLVSKNNPYDYKLPDFTFMINSTEFYWEHLGMLSVDSYKKSWDRKLRWYKENGYYPQLIISQDGEDGSIDSQEIDRLVEQRIKLTNIK